MDTLWADLRYALRLLRKAPGFTLSAVALIALGIGANSAVFSLVDTVLLRPLPYTGPNELVALWEHPPGYARNRVSPLNFLDWSEQNRTFASMAAVSGGSRTWTGSGSEAERLPGQAVTVSLFDLLGIRPVAGRTFTADDARPDTRVVVIGERFWKTRLGGDPAAVGRTLTLDGTPYTVIGVVPKSFQIFYESHIWTPFVVQRSPEQRRMHYLQVIGRMKPGVSLEQARADMTGVGQSIARVAPETNKGWTVTVEPLRQAFVGDELRVTSLALTAVAALVLLMGCANVAGLLLARGVGRTREIAVRAALGGSAARLLQQLLIESMLLATLGGAAGVALAWTIVRAAPSFLPPGTLPVALSVNLDLRVIAFAAAATLATGLLFGLAPAWQAARISLANTLRAGGRTATGGTAFRTILAAGEIAVAVMLVAGAGLLLRTLSALSQVDPGCRLEGVLTMQVLLPFRSHSPQSALAFYQHVDREISSLPGVKSVAFGSSLPMDGFQIGQGFEVIGQPAPAESRRPTAHYQMVSARYFGTLGIPLVRGRAFTERDDAKSTPVCIVNQAFVRRHLQGLEPIGTRVRVQAMDMRGPTPVEREIVGVIGQVKVDGLGERQDAVEVYVPLRQNPWFNAAIAVATHSDPLAMVPAVRAAIARVDQAQPVSQVRTMEEVAAQTIARPKFRAGLVGAFAGLALVLAAVGIFGLMAFTVSQRTREFGIRRVLGAQTGDLVGMVLGRGLRIAVAGAAAGTAGALALARSLQALLYGVAPLDPPSFAASAAGLVVVALAACAIPALRAAGTDPAKALAQD